MRNKNIYKNFIAILSSFLFATAFIWTEKLMDGPLSSKTFYFYAVSSVIFFVLSFFLLFRKESFKIQFNMLDIFLLLFLAYCFIRLLFTKYTSINDKYFMWIATLIALYFIWKKLISFDNNSSLDLSGKILITVFLSAGFFQALYGILQLYDMSPGIVGNYFKVIGTFGNPDSYSGYLSSIAPFAFGMYFLIKPKDSFSRFLRYLSLATFLSCMVILPAAYIRASWLAVGVSVFFILNYKFNLITKIKVFLNTNIKKLGMAAALILLTSFLAFFLYQLKPDSAFGRLFIWKVSSQIITERPIFGIGFDRFKTEYDNYQADYFAQGNGTEYEKIIAGNVKQAHNEFIQIWAEIGVIGLLIFCCIIFLVLRSVDSLLAKQKYSFRFILTICAKASLISVLIFSIFSFPLHILPTFLNFVFLLSILGSLNFTSKKEFVIKPVFYKPISAICLSIIIFYSANIIHIYTTYFKWKQAYEASRSGLYEYAKRQYEAIYPALKMNGKFLFTYGGMLSVMGNNAKAEELLNAAKQNFNDPNLYLALGQSYENIGRYQEAEKNYLHAKFMIPHKMYSKYLLAKYYSKNNDPGKAIETANEIMKMNIKIETTAAVEIKKEIRELVKQIKVHTLTNISNNKQ